MSSLLPIRPRKTLTENRTMKCPSELYPYQSDRIIPHLVQHPSAMVWSFMGSGKTVCSLTAFRQLQQFGDATRAIVFGPLRVAHSVWIDDAAEWSHLRGLRFARLTGSPDSRLRELFRTDVDVFLVNYEKTVWLAQTLRKYFIDLGRPLPFDLCIYDEITQCKNSSSNRTKAWAGAHRGNKWLPGIQSLVPRNWGLTGTPLPNGMKDLHGQYLMLDGGQRLGKGITAFKDQYFYQVGQFRELKVKDGAATRMRDAIADITIELREEDYSSLPPLTYVDVKVDLPPKVRQQYLSLEKTFFASLDDGKELEIFNKTSLSNKCLQMASGAVYLNTGDTVGERVHDEKYLALDSILGEIGDAPILVLYQFKSEMNRLLERYPGAVCISGTSAREADEIKNRWNRREIPMLIGHPRSMGHGLNLQKGGNFIAAMGVGWSHEGWQQVIKRLHRTGQTEKVVCYRIIAVDTVDEAQVLALSDKRGDEEAFRSAVAEYRKSRGMS